MDFVIDIQGFRTSNKQFLPKEVAVTAVDHQFFAHWIIRPPYPFSELNEGERVMNNYVTCYHHGIEWFVGDISLERLHDNLQEIAGSSYRILTRGEEKARYLEAVTSRKIINLELTGCPAFGQLESAGEYCFFHGVRKEEFYTCALNNVVRLKKWINACKFLKGYDYPAHVKSVNGTCRDRSACRRVTSSGTDFAKNVRRELFPEQQPPPLPERNRTSRNAATQMYTPPLTPTKPSRRKKSPSKPDSTSCDYSELYDDSNGSDDENVGSLTGNASDNDDNDNDDGYNYEQSGNRECSVDVIPKEQQQQPQPQQQQQQQRETGFPSRSDSPGMDTTVNRYIKHR